MVGETAVIIVNFNSGTLLSDCLRHVYAQTRCPEKIIVVDNASSDSSLNGLEDRYPKITWIKSSQNLGFSAANNLAIEQAGKIEWLALLNPDAFPEPDWLERLLIAAEMHPECASFGSRLIDANDSERLDGTGDVYHISGLAWRRDHSQPVISGTHIAGEIFAPCAAAAIYRCTMVLQAGGFDEQYFCYFEDVDLGFRLRLLGYRCWYVPDAVVRHIGSAVTGRRSAFSLYYGHRNLVWTYFKNMPGIWFWLYLPQHLLLNLGTVLWFALHGQGGIILRAKWDALRELPRVWRQRRFIQRQRRVNSRELIRIMAGNWALLTRFIATRCLR